MTRLPRGCAGSQFVPCSQNPYSAAIGAPADADATGARLAGMTDATFIVTGLFTTDGTGNAVAYSTGIGGWGAIVTEVVVRHCAPERSPIDYVQRAVPTWALAVDGRFA